MGRGWGHFRGSKRLQVGPNQSSVPGHDYYRRKIDEGKSPREAMRCLKRQLAKVVYRRLRDDADRAEHAQLAAAV